MLIATLQLLLGFVLACAGGEVFVRGCTATAALLRIPAAIVAVTVAAFATSSPELSVAINAALAGAPQIALGDALGSNIVNIALIMGLVLCFGSMTAGRRAIARDWLLAFITPVMIWLMLNDGLLDRLDAIICYVIFAVWLGVLLMAAGKHRATVEKVDTTAKHKMQTAGLLALGLALLVGAGFCIVSGAKVVGTELGLSPFITGVTLVALGTSMPELATSLVARLRGHHDIGLGTVVGSNIFNVLIIVATAAVIHPIPADANEVLPAVLVGLATLIAAFPTKTGHIPRWRAVPLLALYAIYIVLCVA